MNTINTSTLRKHVSSLFAENLPEQIRYRDQDGHEVVIPTHTATLDELAFAIQFAAEEQSLASRRRCALDDLYVNARNGSMASARRSLLAVPRRTRPARRPRC